VIKAKHNTEAVQTAPNTLVAGRMTSYKPVAKRPFEEVKADVQKAVLARRAGTGGQGRPGTPGPAAGQG
jgi:hypothetical protein